MGGSCLAPFVLLGTVLLVGCVDTDDVMKAMPSGTVLISKAEWPKANLDRWGYAPCPNGAPYLRVADASVSDPLKDKTPVTIGAVGGSLEHKHSAGDLKIEKPNAGQVHGSGDRNPPGAVGTDHTHSISGETAPAYAEPPYWALSCIIKK